MLSGTHFYHATIKRIVSVFGTLFNNITVGRHSGNTISNIQRVPISYGPSQKFITRMNVDLDGSKVAIKLPRMSFEITSIEYDTTTKLNRLNTTLTSGTNNSPRTRNKMYQSVPYTIGMQLNILARNQEDALQILEQIVPTFSPEYTVTIKDIEGPGSKTDVPFILNGVSFDDTYEGDYVGRRTLTYTLDFTIRARFAPNTSSVSIIKKVETDLADFTNVTTSSARTLSSVNVSSNSPADTIRTFVSLIDPADVHTLDLVYKDITVAGVEPINRLTGISIVSGTTADFDRVEDENFSSSVANLTGVPSRIATASVNGALSETPNVVLDNNSGTISVGMKVRGAGVNAGITVATVTDQNNIVLSEAITLADDISLTFVFGVDASFTALVDGLTGATTGVSILNKGSGYIATETITISTSPYDSVNLVLTVDSVFDGTGEELPGAINTFSITSGNGANSNFTATYTPTFTRTNLATEPVLNSPNDSPGLHGTGAAVNITLDKTGAITAATIARGGADYNTSQQVKLSGVALGETETSFILQNRTTTSSGSGTNATINITLDSQTGALSNPVIQEAGSGYALNDTLTISAAQLGANAPGGAALDTDLVLSITGVNEDGTGSLTSLSLIGSISTIGSISAAEGARTAGTYSNLSSTSSGSGTGATFEVVTQSSIIATIDTISAADTARVEDIYTISTSDYSVLPSGGTGAEFSIIVDSVGEATITVTAGGTGYSVDDTFTIAGSTLGGGADLTFDVATLNSSVSSATITTTGTGYVVGETITIADTDIGGSGSLNLTFDVASIVNTTADSKRVGAKIYEYDAPFTDLVMSIDSIDTAVLNGVYSKSGRLNKKPRYVHTTTSGAEINYNGSQWVLQQSNENLATADAEVATSSSDSPMLNVPLTQWTVVGRDTANMIISTTENLDFNVGERITGNISAGEAIVLSANNNKATVNNLEQLYAEDELVTGRQSGRTRTVFNTRKT